MWKQTKMGNYTNSKDIIRIESLSAGDYILLRNNEYENAFDSYEELKDYIKLLGLEELYLPKITSADNRWREYNGNEHYEKIYSRKMEDGTIQSLVICKFITGKYSIYFRETNYDWIEELVRVSLEFVEANDKNPEDDIELDAYEVGTHGASGMCKSHNDLKNFQEVCEILRDLYDIQNIIK